jgi:hypothetical protein
VASAFVFHACSFLFGKQTGYLNVTKTASLFSSPDLIEKALRKLAGQALKNEIDVAKAWLPPLPVSPPKPRLYSPVVTYFILACSANF